MVPFDRLGYGFLIVFNSNFVPEIFDFEKFRDLEILAKCHSRSSEPTWIDPSPITSY